MRKIFSWQCECCGRVFDDPEDCSRHETAEQLIKDVNEDFASGITLQEINEKYQLWESVPDNLKVFNRDTSFAIVVWELFCGKVYHISEILPNGDILISRYGSTIFKERTTLSHLSNLISDNERISV